MAKIIIEFDAIEEGIDALNAINGTSWKCVVSDIDNVLRNTIKHSISNLGQVQASELEIELAEKYREIISDIISQYNLSI